MTLDAFGRVQYPTVKQEKKLYGIYRCRAFIGTLSSAIAECLSKNGLDVGVFHSSPSYLDNQNGYYPEQMYREMVEEYSNTIDNIKDAVTVKTGFAFTPEWYRGQLEDGKLLIVQFIVPGNADGMHDEVLHWGVVYGYEDGSFLVCDPMSCKIRLSESEFAGYTATPVGSICVTVSGEKTDRTGYASWKEQPT